MEGGVSDRALLGKGVQEVYTADLGKVSVPFWLESWVGGQSRC